MTAVLEFVFVAIIQGFKPASEKFRQRRETQREKRREAGATTKQKPHHSAATKDVSVDPAGRWTIVLLVCMILFAVVTVG